MRTANRQASEPHRSRWHHSALCRIRLLQVLLLASLTALAPGARCEVQLPEERLFNLYLEARDPSDLEAARRGFADLLAARLEQVERLSTASSATRGDLGRYALALDRLASALGLYQGAEMVLRQRGESTPAEEVERVLATYRAVRDHLEGLARADDVLGPPEGEPSWQDRDVVSARHRVPWTMFRTALFLRDIAPRSAREEILRETQAAVARSAAMPSGAMTLDATPRLELPETLAELDARHADLAVAFGLPRQEPIDPR